MSKIWIRPHSLKSKPPLYLEYQKLRRENPHRSAQSILQQLSHRVANKDLFADMKVEEVEPYQYRATWEVDSFVMVGMTELDEYPDLTYLGEVIDARDAHRVPPGSLAINSPCCYFVPQISEEEHYEGLIQLKYGKTQARELARSYVKQDWQRFKQHGISWDTYVLSTHATYQGYSLGTRYLGGVESDSGTGYFLECWKEMQTEVIEEVRMNMIKILANPALLETFPKLIDHAPVQ